jgi:predicted glycosyltransferase
MTTIWVDIINPSHSHFFSSILPELGEYEVFVTLRDRAETVGLANSFGLSGEVIGTDYRDPMRKTAAMMYRTGQLFMRVRDFDVALSFENGMSTLVSRVRGGTSILFCDNDLKFHQKTSSLQDLEMKFKLMADHLIVPRACRETFSFHADPDAIVSFDGYKEDVYIADFKPDPTFSEKIPFHDFIVLRPEALGSFYVKEKASIVPALMSLAEKESLNVVYLPREKADFAHICTNNGVYIPENPINGLDLCYHARAVLTGSGTMAREAACMGRHAVSFFPSKSLLSVDQELIHAGKMLYSRDPEEIIDFVAGVGRAHTTPDLKRSRAVKARVLSEISRIVDGS